MFRFTFSRLRGYVLVCVMLALSAPASLAHGGTPPERQALVSAALRAQLEGTAEPWGDTELDMRALRAYYARSAFRPVWSDAEGALDNARLLFAALQYADREGLGPEDYHVADIEKQGWHSPFPEQQAWLDLLLTDAFLAYSRDVAGGHIEPWEVDPYWYITPRDINPVAMLDAALDAPDFGAALAALPPPHAGYRRLRAVLTRYRALAANGGWPTMPPGPLLRLGSRHPQVALLRGRLRAEGDLLLGPVYHRERFDQAVEAAVNRFQVRHGLPMDGVVGPVTRTAMNVPVTKRIELLALNLERWRWLPRELGERHLIVNTAGFELYAIERGEPRLAMRVIIGKPFRSTPTFSASLYAIVVNPYWNVPLGLALEDLVPRQMREPGYMRARRVRVYDGWGADATEIDPRTVEWSALSETHFPVRLRQDPGPQNPLGRMKFLLGNPYEIYLHDTPERELFNHSVRTFSAGCIRLQQPDELAGFLLSAEQTDAAQEVQELIRTGANHTIELAQPVPVYMVYFTAWVARDGGVHFRDDIYQRDTVGRWCP
ncbi:MAG: L,D-transpeptidase family protein [Pseudomonadota bacterium]|nr:MAG: L,D-transpeptidase family protein [Pseudomonadota bacterium]